MWFTRAPKGLFGFVLEMLSMEIVNRISLKVNQRPVESGAAVGNRLTITGEMHQV
jgi:hypothetical protein